MSGRSHVLRRVGLVILGLAVAALAGVAIVRQIAVALPGLVEARLRAAAVETARSVAADIERTLQIRPEVRVNQTAVVTAKADVLEVTTLEDVRTERLRLNESWLHSTKTLEIEGDFVVRAGFDLTRPFTVTVDADGSGVRVRVPPAQILGVELRDVRFLREEDGFWNFVTPADRERAIRALRDRIREQAARSDLAVTARSRAESRLRAALERPGRRLTFEETPP